MNALRYISKVHIEFDFFYGKSAAARQAAPLGPPEPSSPAMPVTPRAAPRLAAARARRYFLDRVTNPLTLKSNPKCDINIDVHNRRTPPLIKITYTDGVEHTFADNETAGHKIDEIIQNKADRMMLDRLVGEKEWRKEVGNATDFGAPFLCGCCCLCCSCLVAAGPPARMRRDGPRCRCPHRTRWRP